MLQLRVEAIKWETNDTATFFLTPVSGEKIIYKAGQFITLIFSHHQNEIRRSYSLSSSPHEAYLSITVKRMENGEISRFLLTKTQLGDVWNALAPAGKFTVANYTTAKDIFYFAAGSGITPVYAHIKYILAHPVKSNITLVYSSHQAKTALFYHELNKLADEFPDRLKVIYLFSVSENSSPRKRLNNELVTQLVNANLKHPPTDAEFLICGPFVYMRMVRLTLTYMGFEPAQIRKENFVLETVPVSATPLRFAPKQIKLHFNNITYNLMVGENQSILQAALQNKINLPYSCRAGICSTCTAICKSGKVEMPVNDVLTDADLSKGWILTCTGHPVSDDVVIEFP
ncbi:ring-1,2-phenylacetyl-CoA epoxidase subunit PaaE [Mucilaginibacter gracilis]|uniref:Ring-1,2-phenylacetyl-CoA epoxidase subunit PaaE n=1 Tax=Mucilaginibacter gracilis TaxID=423350 RepID=A0A495IYF9_9SPHI|nr:ferredoxin--NADP reductase [Mucilaginibacter gracilis]RKR81602.1 ring-1,2-phenylacetyl-CoA epoxidase subunit PaaE [Mucilaginibacter gracilis]